MSRFAIAVLLVALAVAVQGFPTGLDDVATAAAEGDWKKVSELLEQFYKTRYGFEQLQVPSFTGIQDLGTADVRSLKPQGGGHVWAESDYKFHSATNDNGMVRQLSGGHRILNQDGKVTEMDYEPKAPY